MKQKKIDEPRDPTLHGATAALIRAGQKARELARQTRTPCYVVRNGYIVDAITGKKIKRLSK